MSCMQVVSYEESEDITEAGSHEEGSASVEVHLHPHLEPLESKMLSGVMPPNDCACSASQKRSSDVCRLLVHSAIRAFVSHVTVWDY